METYLISLVAYISFFIFTFANGVKIQIVNFRVLRKHPDIRKCSMAIINNQTAVGGRISDITGKCEHLGVGLDEQQIFETGYGYVEKVGYKQVFQKPEKLLGEEAKIFIDFPRIITTGSMLDFTFRRNPPAKYQVWLDQGQGESPIEHRLNLWIQETSSPPVILIDYEEGKRNAQIDFDWERVCPLHQCKLSVLVFDGYIQLLANNEMISNGIVESALTEWKQMGRASVFLNFIKDVKLDSFMITK